MLADQRFVAKGYLTGLSSNGDYWVVLDPNRHPLRVWQKRQGALSYIFSNLRGLFTNTPMTLAHPWFWTLWSYRYEANARALGAAAFSNGPMMEIPAPFQVGRLLIKHVGLWTIISALGAGIATAIVSGNLSLSLLVGGLAGMAGGALGGIQQAVIEAAKLLVPYGFVKGQAAGIDDPGMGYNGNLVCFGRGPSTAFSSYRLTPGKSAAGYAEAMGGLIPLVINHVPSSNLKGIGYNPAFANLIAKIGISGWGLIPLAAAPVPPPDGWPGGEVFHGPYRPEELDGVDLCMPDCDEELDGLIIVAGSGTGGASLANCFATIGVRDGVAMDGSDSVMVGSKSESYLGDMPWYKDVIQRYGFCCG